MFSSEPPPNTVSYNDWRQVTSLEASTFVPSDAVTVVVPYYDAPEALVRALAALERQSYPRELIEVVIVDDGSPTALSTPSTPLDVQVVRQEDCGFGLARARNNGARAASHDILIFLDCDMMAEAGFIMAHARWHHHVADALTLGMRSFADASHLSPETVRSHLGSFECLFEAGAIDPPWNERHLVRTRNLTTRHDDLFRMIQGSNFGIKKSFYELIGGTDESFTSYGGEDTEMAYRAYVRGGLLVPLPEAYAWHQGRWAENRQAKKEALSAQRDRLASLIPLPEFRAFSPGRTYAVPCYIITVERGDIQADQVAEEVQSLLADPQGDLAVRIEMSGRGVLDEGVVTRLKARFASDPRVLVAPTQAALDEFPVSPFHIRMTVAPGLARRVFHELQRRVGDRVAVTIGWGSKDCAKIERAWALHRARRTGRSVATFGDVATVQLRTAPMTKGKRPRHWPRHGSDVHRVLEELRRVRDVRSGWRFLRWLEAAIRWRLGKRT